MEPDALGVRPRDACPRCGQDLLALFSVKATDEQIIVCPECEATWQRPGAAAEDSVDLSTFLRARGLSEEFNVELAPT
jgi:hypothetical protein